MNNVDRRKILLGAALLAPSPALAQFNSIAPPPNDVIIAPWAGDGVSNRAPEFAAGLNAAEQAGKILELPAGVTRLSAGVLQQLAVGASLAIQGQGSLLSTLRIDAVTAGALLEIGRDPEVGGLSIEWPNSQGDTFRTEFPTTALSANVNVGEYLLPVVDASTIAVGDLIKIKAQRLWIGENRNHECWGELDVVKGKSGNTLILEAPMACGYVVGLQYSGTLDAGGAATLTMTTINSSTPIVQDLIVGCRVRVVGGTGSGQTRYISAYDPTTHIATIDSPSSPERFNSPTYLQNDFSPALDNTSVVQIDAQPYVFVIKPAAGISVSGVTIDCDLSAGGVPVGLLLKGMAALTLDDVRFVGTSLAGIRLRHCWRPRLNMPTFVDCNRDGLGYGALFDECRSVEVYEIQSYNSRRPIDCTGDIPTHVGRFQGGNVIGGYSDQVGVPWSTSNLNYGLGSHGQSCDWVFSNITVEGVMVGTVQRGVREVYDNIAMIGPMLWYYWLLRGRDTTIINPMVRTRSSEYTYPPLPAPPVYPTSAGNGGAFIYTGSQFFGRVAVIGGHLEGLQGTIVFQDVNAGLSVGKRCNIVLSLPQDLVVNHDTPGTAYVIDADDTFVARGWDIRPFTRSIRGGGTLGQFNNIIRSASSAGENTLIRVGDRSWCASVADDTVVAITSPLGDDTQLEVRVFPYNNSSTIRINGILRALSTTWSPYSTSLGSVTTAALATKPNGTSGTDGNISLNHDGNQFYLENRTGVQVDLTIVLGLRN